MNDVPFVATDTNFQTEVIDYELPVMIDFWAEWCGPCRMVAPHVEAVAQQFEGRAKVYKLDVDQEGEIAARYGIMSIPTLMFFKGGKPVDQIVGAQHQKAIADRLEKIVSGS